MKYIILDNIPEKATFYAINAEWLKRIPYHLKNIKTFEYEKAKDIKNKLNKKQGNNFIIIRESHYYDYLNWKHDK